MFTTKDIINGFSISPTPTLFHHPRFKVFIQRNLNDLPTILTSIIDLLHPAPESPYLSCIDTFEGWLCIPFTCTIFFTHFRYPHPSEILTLYELFALIPLYPCTISALHIRTLVLYILSFRVSNHIDNNFLSTLFHQLSLRLLTFNVSVIALHCNRCQLSILGMQLINKSRTNIFIDHFTINAQLDQSTILNLPAVFRTSLSHNKLGLLEGRLVYYE